jgi:O-antigen ligase
MHPTSWRLLLVTGAIGFAVGFLGARFWDLWTGSPPTVPWAAPMMLFVLAVGFAVAAWTLRPRIQRRKGHRPLDPFVAARTAVLALAGSRTGAAVAGVYLGYAGFLLLDLANDYRRRMVLVSLAAAAAGLAMAAAALWLERICRVKGNDDEPGGPTSAPA